jgi:hypothetical protein
LNTLTQRWLTWLADPQPRDVDPPPEIGPRELSDLLDAAELHGVLALCLDGLRRPDANACGSANEKDDHRTRIVKTKSDRSVNLVSVQMLLAHHGEIVCKALASRGLPFTIVKGQTFARLLYPAPILRRYTDIDVLIPIAARAEVSSVLSDLGFKLHQMEYRGGADYFEDKWTLDADQEILIEVHCDLVHNPKLRRAFGLRYEDVVDAGRGNPADATALLLVAGSHGAISHQFDRLLQVIDVLQCARGAAGPIDVARLRTVADRCGLTLAVAASLSLASETFADENCKALLKEFAPRWFDARASRLLAPSVTLAAQSNDHRLASLRRKLFRQALRYSATNRAA